MFGDLIEVHSSSYVFKYQFLFIEALDVWPYSFKLSKEDMYYPPSPL